MNYLKLTGRKWKEANWKGILLTGGQGPAMASAEIYIPPQGPFPSFQCQLFPLPEARWHHTQTGLLACGGGYEQQTCVKWDNGQWVYTHELERVRYQASDFDSDEGVILMGSSDYPGNIFAIELDQNPVYGDGNVDSRRPWDLKHGASYSCSIQERDTNTVVVIIEKYVTRYGQNGFLADLPELNVGRFALTCGGYYQDDGTKVMLVAGGDDDGSVEIRRGDGDAPWVMTTPLPIIKNKF